MFEARRLLHLLLAVMIISLMMPLSAFAAGDGSITIEPQPNVNINRADFTAYKIFDVTVDSTGTLHGYEQVGTQVTSFLALPGMAARYGADEDAFLAWLRASRTTAEMTQLTLDLRAGGFVAIAADNPQVGANVTFSNLDYGYYLVAGRAISKEDPTQIVVAHSMLVTVHPNAKPAGRCVTIKVKADAPKVEKEVSDTNGSGYSPSETVAVGDTIYYEVKSAVPDMRSYASYTFRVIDTLGNGLAWPAGFAKSNVSVTVGGTAFNDFTFNVSGKVMTLDFSNAAFLALSPDRIGQPIVIRYPAVVTSDAVRAPGANKNSVELVYSNDPYTNGTGKSKPKEAEVYTLGFDIDKRVNTATGAPLAGVVFNVHTNANGAPGTALKFSLKSAGNATNPSVYVLNPAGSEDLVTPASGKISVEGLDEGTYWIVEKSAPEGYVKAKPISVTLINTLDGAGKSTFVPPVVTVINKTGGILPGTGGIGTSMFYAVGLTLAVLLSVVYVASQRKNSPRAGL